MTRKLKILFLICVIISSCKQNEPNKLIKLTDEWRKDNTSLWLVKDEMQVAQLEENDTSNIKDYVIRHAYTNDKLKDLNVEKIILIASRSQTKISETDIYKKKLSPDFETILDLTYDYQSKTYSASIMDSVMIQNEIESVEIKDNQENAKNKEWFLCGTTLDNFSLRLPKKISKDSALSIIQGWTVK